ncbi:WD40 repeat-like protein [Rhizopus microsporus var. microsporus]|uniref:WD40 repeat-like protein n=2 Tax=Rhizopus microsporus TaxID=58291 RepID=A0A2G4SIK8_RHIZD|nr:WD40 repeat-like protein [Rhizopus microsporus ATCC 52813]ORE02129.1 WD40 repeat-like protein [Rhizopus microsporus var. microsporus]PHZ08582.1 WD40 repeat-like protein [Rhizopus microsporus ATCC 52813]
MPLNGHPNRVDRSFDQDEPIIRERLSGAINAISMSPEGNAVVVAGREILKVLSFSKTRVVETLNLRAGSQLNLNYSSNDVKWGNNATKYKVATAATNGAIILWDLHKVGRKSERVITEHSRAVNRISFQPDNGNILLSASQDGMMKCWDFRDSRNSARYRFEGKSESVRDVQFNPVNIYEFAAAFETGTIQKWDIRNPKALYDRKLNAHNGPCLTVDWHSGGKLVASGGRDRTIKVWDMSTDNRRPLYTIRTVASVSRIQWRPGYEDEIASCALLTDNRIHIWDIRRPHIAKYVFDEHDTTPTGFLWSNSDELLSVSKDKWFIKQNIKRAYQPVDLLKRNGMGWNVHGDIAFTIDRSERSSFVDESLIPKAPKNWKKLGVRTSFDEEVIQYIPPQSCGIAHMPLFDFKAFCIFAEKYIISSDNVAFACDQNAELAWKMGRYRTSQTWRIIALLYNEQEKDVENEQLDAESIEEAKIKEERQHNEVQGSIDSYEQLSQSSGYTDSLNTTLSQTQVQFSPQTPWQHDATVMELFNYYTEQGDVQMCVTLYLVLEKYLDIDENRLEDWFTAYIDLLHRFKLWSTATAIIKACKVQNVRERNENATTINVACNTCFKLVQGTSNGAWACDKCHRLLNPCTICHQTVKGLYVWCQGCNHGGHLAHMRGWFATEKLCATGCGHACVLQPLSL